MYDRQVDVNERSLRITKVEKQQTMESTEGTAATLAVEATVDPNPIRVLIRKETEVMINKILGMVAYLQPHPKQKNSSFYST